MKTLSLLSIAVISMLCVGPTWARGGAVGGGGMAGGGPAGHSSFAPSGAASVAASSMSGSQFNSMHGSEPFPSRRSFEDRRDGREDRREGGFRRGLFGWGYGYQYPYGVDQPSNINAVPRPDNYDENMQEQDRRRVELPTSAFVKNYSWPNNPSRASVQRSVAGNGSMQKAM
jgi:hypothetical protein